MTPAAPVPHVCRPHRPRSWLERVVERVCAPFVLFASIAGLAALWLASRTAVVGVVVETSSRPAPSDLLSLHDHIYFVAGLTERGDTVNPIEIRSLADYADKLGDRVSYGSLYDDLATFFAEGGTRAYVARVVGAAATKGTLTINDRAGVPVPTLKFDGTSAGAWSSRVSIAVADGAILNTFGITVLYDGVPVEIYPNLGSPADAAAQMAISRYVAVTNLASVSAAPTNNPAVTAGTPLTAGTDDRGAVVAAGYVAALARFAPELGTGDVAIPGQSPANVGAGIKAHALATGRLGLVVNPSGQTTAQAKAATVTFLSASSDCLGYFYNWIYVDDGVGGRRLIPPDGYIAAAHARGKRAEGPWRAPAGDISRARTVLGVERPLVQADINDLNDNQVNPIVFLAGSVQLYGWRSLSTDVRNFRLLTGRDVLNTVSVLGKAKLTPYVFGTVDGRGHFQHQLETELRSVLEPMLNAGGLYERHADDGALLSPGYTVDAGPGVNTVEVLANDEVRVDVGLRVSPTGELIRLRITKVAFDAAL